MTLEAVALVWTLEVEVGVAVVGAAVTVGVVVLVRAWEIEVGLLMTVETGSLVVVDVGRLVEAGMLSVGIGPVQTALESLCSTGSRFAPFSQMN